jgi:hypothetical protein
VAHKDNVMRLMIAVVTIMVVSVLGLSMLTPAGAELTGKDNRLEASVNQAPAN